MRARITPSVMPLPRSTFDREAGTVEVGANGEQYALWRLWDTSMPPDGQPMGGALHGVVLHNVAEGGTNLLRVLAAGVAGSGSGLVEVEWIDGLRGGAGDQLAAVANLVDDRRQQLGPWRRWAVPSVEMPLRLVVIDGADMIDDGPPAVRGLLARLLDADGLARAGAAGVAFVVGARRHGSFAATAVVGISSNRWVFDREVRYLVRDESDRSSSGVYYQVYYCPAADCPVSWPDGWYPQQPAVPDPAEAE